MIDMHSHILPNIDDGAKSIEETYNLLNEAQQVGFKAVITTPHYIEGYYESEVSLRRDIINQICEKLKNNNKKIRVYLGNEVYLSENIIQGLQEEKICSINNTDYILFEMPLTIEPMNLYDIIYEMLQHKLKPILAHPERYTFIQKNPQIVCDLIQKEVLMQANYASIIGKYGKRAQITLKKLLRNNMIHFLGTDTHRQNTIYPKIPQILIKLNKVIGQAKLEELTTTNPQLVLDNKPIDITKPEKIKTTFIDKLLMNFM